MIKNGKLPVTLTWLMFYAACNDGSQRPSTETMTGATATVGTVKATLPQQAKPLPGQPCNSKRDGWMPANLPLPAAGKALAGTAASCNALTSRCDCPLVSG